MNALAELSDSFLARNFDAGTLERARSLVAAGAVHRPEIGMMSANSVTATADVQGSREQPYQVQLHVEAPNDSYAGWLFTVCTCPVRSVCKHGAALALTLRQTFIAPVATEAAWRRSLERLVGELERHQPADPELHPPVPLALEITLDVARGYHAAGPSLRMRPLRQGKSRPWVKTGAEWKDMASGVTGFLPEQAEALATLHTQWATHRGYFSAGAAPGLDEFGMHLVRSLRAARDAGVALVTEHPLRSVTIADDAAEVIAELEDTDSGTALRAVVSLSGHTWRRDQVILIGSPAEFVGLVDDDGALIIAETTAPVPPALRHLVDGPPIVVPPADVESFQDSLPGLMRLVQLHA